MKQVGDEVRVYASHYYYLELNTARMLCELDLAYEIDEQEAHRVIPPDRRQKRRSVWMTGRKRRYWNL